MFWPCISASPAIQHPFDQMQHLARHSLSTPHHINVKDTMTRHDPPISNISRCFFYGPMLSRVWVFWSKSWVPPKNTLGAVIALVSCLHPIPISQGVVRPWSWRVGSPMRLQQRLVLTDMHRHGPQKGCATFQKVVKQALRKRSFVLLVFPYCFIEVFHATHAARRICQSCLIHSSACLFICGLICNMHCRIGDKSSSICICRWNKMIYNDFRICIRLLLWRGTYCTCSATLDQTSHDLCFVSPALTLRLLLHF